jgi:hypothetical protein
MLGCRGISTEKTVSEMSKCHGKKLGKNNFSSLAHSSQVKANYSDNIRKLAERRTNDFM